MILVIVILMAIGMKIKLWYDIEYYIDNDNNRNHTTGIISFKLILTEIPSRIYVSVNYWTHKTSKSLNVELEVK